MPLRTYDPSQVTIVFAGIPISGFADGTFLSVEQNEDSFTLQIGTDGEGTRSKTNNRSGRVTLTLMQSSMANDLLASMHSVDLLSPSGDGIGPLLIKDISGRSMFAAEKAWIVRAPTGEFGREATSRDWVIETDHLIQSHGGN